MVEIKKELENSLRELRKIKGLMGSLLAKTDGLLIASDLPARINSRLVAAMAAAIVKSSRYNSREFKFGEVNNVIINASDGKYVCFLFGPVIFASLLKPKVNLGLVLLEMERKVKEIVGILGIS